MFSQFSPHFQCVPMWTPPQSASISGGNSSPSPPSPFIGTYSGSSNSLDVTSLSVDQLECLCLVLENCDNFSGLAYLLTLAENSGLLLAAKCPSACAAQKVLLRAKAALLFHQGRFQEFKEHIRRNQFAVRDHSFLQHLWNEAHYIEAEQQRSRPLDSVSRYRIRRKNVYPLSIWDGEMTSYCFKKSARKILGRAYLENPMPNQQQKAEMAKQTQLSVLQVSNWFKNQRQRARQHQRHFQLQQQIFQENQADSDGAESEEPCPSSYTPCERPARVSQHQQQANAQNDRQQQPLFHSSKELAAFHFDDGCCWRRQSKGPQRMEQEEEATAEAEEDLAKSGNGQCQCLFGLNGRGGRRREKC